MHGKSTTRLLPTRREMMLWTIFCACIARDPVAAAEPKPLPDLSTRKGEDWGEFLGPTGNGRSGLPDMQVPWPAAGPKLVWNCTLGEGYCAPAVARGRAIVFDRVDNTMRVRCLEAESGRPLWEHSYASTYRDSFGYDGGPRAGPVIAGDRVITFGPEGRLECRSLADGQSLWHIDTQARYHVVQNFFGVGAAPLLIEVNGNQYVVVQVGGSRPDSAPAAPDRLDLVKGLDSGLVAFDLATGLERWRSSSQLASYSVPVVATIGGDQRLLAWMRDAFLVVDPATGGVLDEFRWRADELFSVVAASPVVRGSEVLLSETYGPGSVLLNLKNDRVNVVRKDRDNQRPRNALKAHWATPAVYEGHLYGSSGRNSGDAELVCVDWKTGEVVWNEPGLGRASVVVVGSHLIVLGEFGDVVLVKATPEKYVEVSRTRPLHTNRTPKRRAGQADAEQQEPAGELLAPPCWAAPVVAHGYLYLRGQGRLACFDLLGARVQTRF